MNRVIAVTVVVVALASCASDKRANGTRVVLPSPALLGCKSYSCSQVWQDRNAGASAVYPKQVTIDVEDRGVMAVYDQSIRIEDIKTSIDDRYGRWAFANNGDLRAKLWRVESEKFAIQLSESDEGKRVIYLAFR